MRACVRACVAKIGLGCRNVRLRLGGESLDQTRGWQGAGTVLISVGPGDDRHVHTAFVATYALTCI